MVEALGIALNAPENKGVLDILGLRERRLDAALGKENTTIANLANFCVAERSVLHAQATASAASATISAPPVPTTTFKAVSNKRLSRGSSRNPMIDGKTVQVKRTKPI